MDASMCPDLKSKDDRVLEVSSPGCGIRGARQAWGKGRPQIRFNGNVRLLDDMGCQAGVESAKLTTAMKHYKITTTESYDTIKLGIDAHAKWYYVARQLDGATPQPVQKMDIDGLLHFVAKQQGLAREVHTCYETGAFGYYLHRKLEAMGVSNLVVQAQDRYVRGIRHH